MLRLLGWLAKMELVKLVSLQAHLQPVQYYKFFSFHHVG